MKNDRQLINNRQLYLLIFSFILSTADITLPSIVARISGRDSWITVIVAGIISTLIVFLISKLTLSFKAEGVPKDIISYTRNTFGNLSAGILSVVLVFFLIITNTVVIRELTQILYTIFLPEIEIGTLAFLTIITISVPVILGIECIARLNELLLPLGVLALLVVISLNLTQLNMKNFLPLLEDGLTPVLQGAIPVIGWLIEGTIIIFIIQHINKPRSTPVSVSLSVATVTVALMSGTLIICVFGQEYTSKLLYPAGELVRFARVGQFYETLDVFILLIWTGGILIKATIVYYLTVKTAASVVNSDMTKAFTVPVGLLTFALSLYNFENPINMIEFLTFPYHLLEFVVLLIIPLMLVILAYLKKRTSVKRKPA